MRLHRLALCLLLAAAACNGAAPTTREDRTPTPSDSSPPTPPISRNVPTDRLKRGLDVSWHSGAIDWGRVAEQGYGFAFVKATEGVDLKDPTFDTHWDAVKDVEMVRGAYHFYVTDDDPLAQARFFIETVRLESGDLLPVVDIETVHSDSRPGWPDRLRVWLEAVEKHFGVKPIIYTSRNFWNRHFGAGFGDYPLWIAEYDVDAPAVPEGWSTWRLWQWAGDQEIPGVEKSADESRINPQEDPSGLLLP